MSRKWQFCDAGWDKCSYGYHGDDGNSFCSSGPAQPYGPTFTTGDVIGCCLNLVDNTCFYTKNGVNLGNFLCGFVPVFYECTCNDDSFNGHFSEDPFYPWANLHYSQIPKEWRFEGNSCSKE